MFVTARQLEDLHKYAGGNSHVTLPYRARLTPLAADYVRLRKLVLGYSDVTPPGSATIPTSAAAAQTGVSPAGTNLVGLSPLAASPCSARSPQSFVWWCDGPCGPSKAAVVAEEKASSLKPLEIPADVRQTVAVIKALAAGVKSSAITGGILLVQNAGLAVVAANRCSSLRAIVGTTLESVDAGVSQVGANVLLIEYPKQTLPLTRNLLSRFLRGRRPTNEELIRQLQELSACG